MKRVLLALVLLCVALPALANEPLQTGLYKLKGSNPGGEKDYIGQIVIQKEGSNYRVTWLIGPKKNQAQTGIGILENGVLSIGYMDASGADFGVVSMNVIQKGLLRGHWASIFSRGTQGKEEFQFESETLPKEFTPEMNPKGRLRTSASPNPDSI
jgi:hypothetical protein